MPLPARNIRDIFRLQEHFLYRVYKLLTPSESRFYHGIEGGPWSNLLSAALLSTFDRVSCILKDSASLALRSAEVTPTEVWLVHDAHEPSICFRRWMPPSKVRPAIIVIQPSSSSFATRAAISCQEKGISSTKLCRSDVSYYVTPRPSTCPWPSTTDPEAAIPNTADSSKATISFIRLQDIVQLHIWAHLGLIYLYRIWYKKDN
jgi:hypothetical protein